MSTTSIGRRRARRTVGLTGAALAGALVVASPALAGSATTALPNGAELTVTVGSPVTGDTFVVPAGQTTVDVPLSGTASVATGAPSVSWVFVVDVSTSTTSGCTGTSDVLGCEKSAVIGLTNLVVTDGSAIDVGLGIFAGDSETADISSAAGDQLVTAPDDPDVTTAIGSISQTSIGQFTAKTTADGTNFASGLQAANTILAAASGATKNVVFLSDGASNLGAGDFAAALATVSGQATIYPFAVGAGASCTGGSAGTLDAMAAASGTACAAVPDPSDLPDVIRNVTATSLDSLGVTLDGGAVASTTSLALPQPGPASVAWGAPGDDLAPGGHQVCATVAGTGPASDATATASTSRCETFSVFGFALTPATATNELGTDDTHAVTATVTGPAGELAGWPVDFAVSAGPNLGESGTCAPATCATDASGQVTFTYTVPQEPASLGTDTISGTLDVNGDTVTLEVHKTWQDTTPPVAQCVESTNPDGSTPGAPGNGGQGQNQDGYYRLVATDDIWPADQLDVFVKDTGSSTVFGPFAVGTDVKWTQANGSKPSQKPGDGAVEWNLKGRGDLQVHAVDGSGNVSATVTCRVPSAPQ